MAATGAGTFLAAPVRISAYRAVRGQSAACLDHSTFDRSTRENTMKSTDTLVLLVLTAALGAIPSSASAQTATATATATDTETLTRTGTGTGTRTGDAAQTAGSDSTEGLTRTGTGTGTRTQATDSGSTEGLTRTGTGTGTRTEALMMAASPWTLEAQQGSVTGPGSNTITLLLPADPNAAADATATYTVTLSSSDSACTVPASVELTWMAATGGSSKFIVECAAVDSARNVTITGGTATASFDLLAK
jgi:hypothetical protein